MEMETDTARAARAAQQAEARERRWEARKATVDADGKWDWYNTARADFTAKFGTPNDRYREVPHCSRCQRLCPSRFSAIELCGPQPARVGNEDPPELGWYFINACTFCWAQVSRDTTFEKVVSTEFGLDDVENLLTRIRIQGTLRTYLLLCYSESLGHIVHNNWMWQAMTDTPMHPFQ